MQNKTIQGQFQNLCPEIEIWIRTTQEDVHPRKRNKWCEYIFEDNSKDIDNQNDQDDTNEKNNNEHE